MSTHNSSIVLFLTVIFFSNFLVTKSFHDKRSVSCDSYKRWRTVYYENIGVSPPGENLKGLRAERKSCLTSAIDYKAGYKLLVPVYMNVFDENSGLNISLFKEDDPNPYTTYTYREENTFGVEWYYLIIAVDVNTTTRVNIQGQCKENELILLDSYKYAPVDNNIISNDYNVVFFNRKDNVLIDDYMEMYSHPAYSSDIFDGSGEESGDGEGHEEEENEESEETDTTPTEVPILAIEEPEGFWNPLTISLVTVGSAVVLGLIIGIAYYVGTLKADPLLVDNMEEPPRTVTIPRVRDVYIVPSSQLSNF